MKQGKAGGVAKRAVNVSKKETETDKEENPKDKTRLALNQKLGGLQIVRHKKTVRRKSAGIV